MAVGQQLKGNTEQGVPAPTKYQAHDGAVKALNWDGLRDTIWSAGTDGAIRMFSAHFFVSAPPCPPSPLPPLPALSLAWPSCS